MMLRDIDLRIHHYSKAKRNGFVPRSIVSVKKNVQDNDILKGTIVSTEFCTYLSSIVCLVNFEALGEIKYPVNDLKVEYHYISTHDKVTDILSRHGVSSDDYLVNELVRLVDGRASKIKRFLNQESDDSLPKCS
jgi:hypothetical protein